MAGISFIVWAFLRCGTKRSEAPDATRAQRSRLSQQDAPVKRGGRKEAIGEIEVLLATLSLTDPTLKVGPANAANARSCEIDCFKQEENENPYTEPVAGWVLAAREDRTAHIQFPSPQREDQPPEEAQRWHPNKE
jgi:hypothetical protein